MGQINRFVQNSPNLSFLPVLFPTLLSYTWLKDIRKELLILKKHFFDLVNHAALRLLLSGASSAQDVAEAVQWEKSHSK